MTIELSRNDWEEINGASERELYGMRERFRLAADYGFRHIEWLDLKNRLSKDPTVRELERNALRSAQFARRRLRNFLRKNPPRS